MEVASNGSTNPEARPIDRQLCFQNSRRWPVANGMTRGSSMATPPRLRISVDFAAASLQNWLEYTYPCAIRFCKGICQLQPAGCAVARVKGCRGFWLPVLATMARSQGKKFDQSTDPTDRAWPINSAPKPVQSMKKSP